MFSINSKSIKYLETARGVAFTAELLLDGVKVGTIENAGQGGHTHADLLEKCNVGILERAAYEHEDCSAEVEYYLEHLMDVAEGIQGERFDLSDMMV